MKKLYTLVTLLMISASSAFAQSADLAIIHNVQTGDTIEISSTPPQYVFRYGFINFGPDTLSASDTIFLSTPYDVFSLLLPQAGLAVGDTVYFFDTTGFNQGPATGPSQWCDSIWAKNAGGVIGDTSLANNKLCTNIYILNTSTSISETFGSSKGSKTASLNIYPNPATTSVSFEYYSGSYAEAYIQIADVTGRRVHMQHLGKVQGAKKADIDVSNFSNGLYIVELRVGSSRQVGKFYIQK